MRIRRSSSALRCSSRRASTAFLCFSVAKGRERQVQCCLHVWSEAVVFVHGHCTPACHIPCMDVSPAGCHMAFGMQVGVSYLS